MRGLRRILAEMTSRHGLGVALFVGIGVLFWILVLIVLPQISMLDFSFRHNLPRAEIGGPRDTYTLDNYRYFLFGNGSGFNTLDIGVLFKTFAAAAFVTVIDIVICYPIAFILAHSATGVGARLMVVGLIVPFWINDILRAFAFRVLFGATGVINGVGQALGLWDTPIDFIRADVALYSALAYTYVLMMVFSIFGAIETLDRNQIEAARDMGASWWRVHWRVVLPVAKPGIASGATMVFMLTAGALAAPQILGGPSNLWFTQLVYQWFNDAGDWQRGAAYSAILLFVCLIFVFLTMRVFRVSIGAIGR